MKSIGITTALLNRNRRCAIALACLLMFPIVALAQISPATAAALRASASRGEDLFAGRVTFRNRGPACISCHSITGLSFPNGGTLAPDLTETYNKLGPDGTAAAMQTLYFPVMSAIYSQHQLVPQEQADLVAFFKQADAQPRSQSPWTTQILILAIFLLAGAFIALTAFFWRNRMRSVRQALVDRATRQGARS